MSPASVGNVAVGFDILGHALDGPADQATVRRIDAPFVRITAIEGLVRDGTTLLLTTQYLEEADRLADTIAVVDHGKVIARGSSDELKLQVGGERLELVAASTDSLTAARDTLARLGIDEPSVEPHTRSVGVSVTGGAKTLLEALRQLDEQGIEVSDVGLRRPTLDDVFLTLTGQRTEPGEDS